MDIINIMYFKLGLINIYALICQFLLNVTAKVQLYLQIRIKSSTFAMKFLENKIMLRIAVQSKGRLFEDTMSLLAEADIKVSSSKRTLLVQSTNFPIEVLFLRDDDIPQSEASGVADLGVVGENEFVERGEDAEIISRLGFSKCRISLAIPQSVDYKGLEWFNGKKIATSYPNILRKYMDNNGINAEVHVITGSVEIAPGIHLADAIFDIVSSGSTLISNNLSEV